MNEHLKKSIILEHYDNPVNKGLVNDDGYKKINMNSSSCIDNLDFMVKIEDGVVKDARFDGEACAISTAASSIMMNLIIGKTVEEVKEIIDNYNAMIEEKDYDENLLGKANVFSGVSKQANRKKCALLPFMGLEKILDDKKDEKDEDIIERYR